MMKMTRMISAVLGMAFLLATMSAAAQTRAPHRWWKENFRLDKYKGSYDKKLPLLSVSGNHFVNEKGETVVLHGVNIPDPDQLAQRGLWSEKVFEKSAALGANLVRVPVHPIAWRERGVDEYLKLLDQAVEWSGKNGMYVIVDWHSIGNLMTEMYQNPMYITTRGETLQFWRTISARYADVNTVAFDEIFNEPTTYSGQLGPVSWSDWKKFNEEAIGVIRANGQKAIPLVTGFDWAYDLTPLHEEPIAAANIAYADHPYPHKRPQQPWEAKWDEDFGFAVWTHPVVLTEFGYTQGKGGEAENGAYGKALIKYAADRGMSWTAWVVDDEWDPQILKSWEPLQLTEYGEFVKKALQEQNHIAK